MRDSRFYLSSLGAGTNPLLSTFSMYVFDVFSRVFCHTITCLQCFLFEGYFLFVFLMLFSVRLPVSCTNLSPHDLSKFISNRVPSITIHEMKSCTANYRSSIRRTALVLALTGINPTRLFRGTCIHGSI